MNIRNAAKTCGSSIWNKLSFWKKSPTIEINLRRRVPFDERVPGELYLIMHSMTNSIDPRDPGDIDQLINLLNENKQDLCWTEILPSVSAYKFLGCPKIDPKALYLSLTIKNMPESIIGPLITIPKDLPEACQVKIKNLEIATLRPYITSIEMNAYREPKKQVDVEFKNNKLIKKTSEPRANLVPV